jgi:Mlc titration factor MtfA (ptsG expression regulator)
LNQTNTKEKPPEDPAPIDPAWEARSLRTVTVLSFVVFLALAALFIWLSRRDGPSILIAITASAFLSRGFYWLFTRRVRRRRKARRQPFPREWEKVLGEYVVFYQALEPSEKARFRRELQVFIAEKRITGIKTDIDDKTRVLAAASAILPIFGFPDWEWDAINEVLIYPSRFDEEFQFEGGADTRTLGMVGTGAMNRLMILSKPDLFSGFRNPRDARNVGLHEFAHLVDKSDGAVDGLPTVGLSREAIGPWLELVRKKMDEMARGKSDINPYGLTNEAEFFAVATEYFFEKPGIMERKHPELYKMLAQVFQQNLRTRVTAMLKAAKNPRRRLGRNSPCPCGSGKKYKKCCL